MTNQKSKTPYHAWEDSTTYGVCQFYNEMVEIKLNKHFAFEDAPEN